MRLLFGDCRFDAETRTLERGGKAVRLSGKAFQLLELLLAARPRPLAREELFARLWPDTFVSDANLASLVKEIRAAIGDDARQPRFLRTAHRFGYAFAGGVTEAPEPKAIDSIAVLPFANASGMSDLDYLAEGLAESLVNTLTTIDGLRVAPRVAAFRFRDTDLEAVRRQLNVRAALTGTIRAAGERLILQVELSDLARHAQLWGSRFEAPLRDIVSLQDDLASGVVAALRVRRPRKHYGEDAEAYQLYLKGRHHWNRRTAEGIERAIFYFESAIDRDAGNAPAYSGLADCYIALASRDLHPPLQLFPKAETAARRALALDGELAEAHASMAAIEEVFHRRWDDAEREYLEALRLQPGYLVARQWYALALAHRGRFPEAVAQMEVAAESDPLSFTLNANLAVVHYLGRCYDAGEEACAKSLEINPHHEPAHFTLGLIYQQRGCQQRGRIDDARAELERALAISRGEPHVVAALGALERSAAPARLEQLAELSLSRYVSPVHMATIHTALGAHDEALAWLERAVQERSGWLVYLRTEPRFDALREDARFAAIIEAT
jgi:TolB-like protein/Flp pilus assembly protein TadD